LQAEAVASHLSDVLLAGIDPLIDECKFMTN